jgi:hypothetical protein
MRQRFRLKSSFVHRLDHHNKILTILKSLDSDTLNDGIAYFGGRTLLALDFEEYRWSKDIGFICPVPSSGYKHLRSSIFDRGYEALFRHPNRVQVGRGTTDQYGIRMVIFVDGEPIKTKIIAEARFEPDPHRYPE